MRLILLALCAAFVAAPASAYVGPGAGLGALAATLAIVLGVVLLAVGFLWYPIKRMMRKKPADDTPKQG
mgnify:FL=1